LEAVCGSFLAREHRKHPRHRRRLVRRDAPDDCVSMRRAHHRGVRLARQVQVVGETTGAGQQPIVLLAPYRLTQRFFRQGRCQLRDGHPIASISRQRGISVQPFAAAGNCSSVRLYDRLHAAREKAPPDLKEGFFYGMELPDEHPWARKKIRGFGHNQWPDLAGFREQMLAYQAALRAVGDRVLAMLALSLELPEDFFAQYYDMPNTTLGLLRYAPHPAHARPNQLGAG